MSIAILILQYGKSSYTVECVTSLLSYGLPEDVSAVYCIDNCSPDERDRHALTLLAKFDDRIKVVFNDRNYGFAEGNNRIIRELDDDYVLLLNNDTKIIDGSFRRFLQFCHLNNIDVGTGTLINSDYTPQPSTLGYYGFPGPFKRIVFALASRIWVGRRLRRVAYANGALLWLRRKLFSSMGEFDSSLFMYGEDLDLMIRLDQMRIPVIQDQECRIIHYGGGSADQFWEATEKLRLQYRQSNSIIRRHYPLIVIRLIDIAYLPVCVSKTIFGILKGDFGAVVREWSKYYWKVML